MYSTGHPISVGSIKFVPRNHIPNLQILKMKKGLLSVSVIDKSLNEIRRNNGISTKHRLIPPFRNPICILCYLILPGSKQVVNEFSCSIRRGRKAEGQLFFDEYKTEMQPFFSPTKYNVKNM